MYFLDSYLDINKKVKAYLYDIMLYNIIKHSVLYFILNQKSLYIYLCDGMSAYNVANSG